MGLANMFCVPITTERLFSWYKSTDFRMSWVGSLLTMPSIIPFVVFMLSGFFGLTQKNINQTLSVTGDYIIYLRSESNLFTTQSRNSISEAPLWQKTAIQQVKTPLNIWTIKLAENNNNIEYLNGIYHQNKDILSITPDRPLTLRKTPNDPDFVKQWQYINDGTFGKVNADLDIDLAWDITTGGIAPTGDTIVICVIDNGMNNLHPDLRQNVWYNYHEIPNNGVDDDGNGYVDDFKGWNATQLNDNVFSSGDHGTSVAGIVGARGNNGIGVSGVNWNVKVMMVNYGIARESNAIASYAYVYQMRKLYNASNGAKGAYIVATNASWGVDKVFGKDAPFWCAMYDSLGSVGVLNCGATANIDINVDIEGDLPTTCESEYLISVTNIKRDDVKFTGAGYGQRSIDLGAYGHQAYTITWDRYGAFGGTSGATPHVTGTIGLLYAAPCGVLASLSKTNPSRAALAAKDMILYGTTPNPSLDNITTTDGRLNTYLSVANAINQCDSCSKPMGFYIVNQGSKTSINWATGGKGSKVMIRYRTPNVSEWQIIDNISSGYELPGLINCTEYIYNIGFRCGESPVVFGYEKVFRSGNCCIQPSNFIVQPTASSITLDWDGVENVEYLLNIYEQNNQLTSVALDSSSLLIDGLDRCTRYGFSIRASCPVFNNVSDRSPILYTSTDCGSCTSLDHCTINDKKNDSEWISKVTLTSKSFESGAENKGYQDYTGLGDIIMTKDQNYNLKVDIGYSTFEFSDYVTAYIDYNQDGAFSAEELAYTSVNKVKFVAEGTININGNALLGNTKLRIILSDELPTNGCSDIFTFGEVEDYCITITQNTCVNSIQGLKIDTSRYGKLLMTRLNPSAERDTIIITYRVVGSPKWLVVSHLDSLLLTGIMPCTMYEYQYRSLCQGQWSPLSDLIQLKSACINTTANVNLTNFLIAPNPFEQSFNITLPDDGQNRNIDIYTINGQFVTNVQSSGVSYMTILTDNWLSGVYLLKVKKDGEVAQFVRLVKW